MKNFFVIQDISANSQFVCLVQLYRLYILTKLGWNRTTILYSCHRNVRFEITI